MVSRQHIKLVNIIGNPGVGMLTRAMAKQLSAASAHDCLFVDFLFEETKKVSEAQKHPRWVNAMQDKLNQFARKKVWTSVLAPYGKTIIGSRWVFRKKRDETRIVIKNKARLVTQGYNQQGGIDYNETFAPVARLEAIKIFLAFANYMNLIVYQMNVKMHFSMKSTSGACQLLGGKLVCWSAKKQQSVAMSSAEAEYLAAGWGFVLGSSGEGDWKSWVRWWSGEKWERWCCKWWREKRLGMNSVHLNVGGRQS
nr:retrovirus-related Pol polyprotein from transposon TNT 1-94 [Tanacetum cinerariifolium]